MTQVAVVIGVGDGMGFALAKRFNREGFTVAMVARNADKLSGYIEELPERAYAYSADASDEQSLKTTFAQIKEQLGSVDVLIYNAAKMGMAKPSELPAEQLVSDFRLNVVGALVSAQAVIPDMRTKGAGAIFFTGGGLALYPSPDFSSLAIGKAGLRNLAYSLGAELAKDGIHVATITIAGGVQANTFFDPNQIADKYWEIYMQPKGQQEREFVWKQG